MQAPAPVPARPVDPVDLLVPPTRRLGSSVLRFAVAVAVIISGTLLWDSGLLRPNLGVSPAGSGWSQAATTSRPEIAFTLRNGGRVPLSIEGVDARAPGLADPVVTLALTGGAVGDGRPGVGSVTVRSQGTVRITMRFGSWDCRQIRLHGSDTVPIHVRSPLGLDSTVSVLPGLHFDPPGTPVVTVGMADANQIGWAAAITSKACHPGSGPVGAGFP